MKIYKKVKRTYINNELIKKSCDNCGLTLDAKRQYMPSPDVWAPIDNAYYSETIEIRHEILEHLDTEIGYSTKSSTSIDLCPKCFREIFKEILKKKEYEKYEF